jgi:hypothetical protein
MDCCAHRRGAQTDWYDFILNHPDLLGSHGDQLPGPGVEIGENLVRETFQLRDDGLE